MIDREQVIKGLELCASESTCVGIDCPYLHNVIDDAIKECDCITELVRDALILLKEQEAKPVKVEKNAYNHEFYYCPRCDRSFYDLYVKPKFCDKCGQAVKWE